jgi:hypothetical protein
MRALSVLLTCCSLLACGTSTTPVDAGNVAADAGVDAGLPPDAGCTGACTVTDLGVTFQGHTGGFTRAQHGLEGDAGLYIEAYFGGDPACPDANSPTPDRTLIISGLLAAGDGGAQTEADGVHVTLLDFTGALSSHPFDRATRVRATPRFLAPGELVSFTLEASFDGGTVSGGFAAPHCASLDGP